MADISSLDQTTLMKGAMDLVLRSNVMTVMVLSNKPEEFRGTQLKKAIQTGTQTSTGSFSRFDRFDISVADTMNQLTFSPSFIYSNVGLAGTDISINSSDANAAVDLIVEKTTEAANLLGDQFGTQFYGDGTGNGSKDIQGLKAIVDDGTATATYGGLTRNTVGSTVKSYRATTTLAGFTTTSPLKTAFSAIDIGTDRVTLCVTTKAVWDTFETMIPYSQVNNIDTQGNKKMTRLGEMSSNELNLSGQIGFNSLYFRGVPVIADEKCSAGYWYMLNMNRLHWAGLKLKDEDMTPVTLGGGTELDGYYKGLDSGNVGMAFTGFKKSTDQWAKTGQIIIGGQAYTEAPNRHGVIVFT